MILACVQSQVTFADILDNLRRVKHWLASAAERSAELVVFPECMLSGYGFTSREEALGASLQQCDPLWDEVIALCKQHSLHVVIGFLHRVSTTSAVSDMHDNSPDSSPQPDQLFNASALIGPQGIVAIYHKVHLPHLGVDRFVDRGQEGFQVHTAGAARVGLGICYDCSFPEPMRVLGLQGADIIALPTNWPAAAYRTAEIVPPARSMENHLYFVAANRIGTERNFTYCGRSSICGPDGVELARATPDDEQLLVAEVDLAAARNKRIERTPGSHVIDRFADRQPQFYDRVAN